MVILKNGYFLRTMKSGFRPFWNETLQILPGTAQFILCLIFKVSFWTSFTTKTVNIIFSIRLNDVLVTRLCVFQGKVNKKFLKPIINFQ